MWIIGMNSSCKWIFFLRIIDIQRIVMRRIGKTTHYKENTGQEENICIKVHIIYTVFVNLQQIYFLFYGKSIKNISILLLIFYQFEYLPQRIQDYWPLESKNEDFNIIEKCKSPDVQTVQTMRITGQNFLFIPNISLLFCSKNN